MLLPPVAWPLASRRSRQACCSMPTLHLAVTYPEPVTPSFSCRRWRLHWSCFRQSTASHSACESSYPRWRWRRCCALRWCALSSPDVCEVIMPELSGLLETSLYVDDLDRSIKFYQALFNFPVMVSLPRMAALAVPNSQVLLLFKKKGSLSGAPGGSHDGDGQLHLAFGIPREEFESWDERLQELGVTISERVTWDRGGRSIYFRDPDGHLIELATPGTWANY